MFSDVRDADRMWQIPIIKCSVQKVERLRAEHLHSTSLDTEKFPLLVTLLTQ